ncbi:MULTISPECIES: 2-succinyl-6-hydroxy-2,4-cyclohexadiene-1-carboxylate synthase [unclassified Virgibacillus]|uniref:2-succinyl-6-hydroxy-2, 4-cyclohexadiene-1-carboxylate synthase n=1 Tax=unclassified Virgibacillus TaxID=2620237 RepID=UPI00090C0CF9|nr:MULTISPECIES: 2-succinyl-6-hydroxy-2,4-cyclohexadiene-1-carboxylate synthase [unclassified Virgibacillus]API90915.1 2-succinyl-6-hydroxy-2,4-cyclohexadiene-1-carboxylate synthase [Virgibacillus sp. 6R]MBS7428888.1 2-succinyl-6-hydroxy-2,4-cyclohexadiene-1-carboxylate synthase [Virgibacillus sp. 19R1-5]
MFFSIGDATYWYEVHGEGKPLVLLHGFTGSSETWQSFVSIWKQHWQVITVDLPGHGKTTANHKSMEACCSDLVSLLKYLNLEPVHLLGYSMGGRTAIAFAMNYPEAVKSLILESTSPGLEDPIERKQRKQADNKLATNLEQRGMDWFVPYWENIPLFITQQQLPVSVQDRIRKERMSHSASGLADSLRFMGTGVQASYWDKLTQFDKPVFLLTGGLDQKYCEIMGKMERILPHAQQTIVSEAGHAIHVEKPNIFGKIVTGCLKGLF